MNLTFEGLKNSTQLYKRVTPLTNKALYRPNCVTEVYPLFKVHKESFK
jgi:hypothetical protein